MNFGVLVDVCLGVLSVMILFSLAATAINEMIADNILNMRGKSLHAAIEGLIRKYLLLSKFPERAPTELRDEATRTIDEEARKNGKKIDEKEHSEKVEAKLVGDITRDVLNKFYTDPAIQSLMQRRAWPKRWFADKYEVPGKYRPPSAIEPEVFAKAIEAALEDDAKAAGAEGFSFENDFKLTMDRVSGWYVRKVKTSLFVIGLVLAIGSNVDILRYARQLSTDANLKTRIDATVGMIDALQVPQGATPPADLSDVTKTLRKNIDDLNGNLATAGMPVGWQCVKEAGADSSFCSAGHHLNGLYPSQFVGWLIIAFGVTLGAQFWFDLFRSLVNLRTPGKTGGTVEEISGSNAPRDGAGEPSATGAAAKGAGG